MLFAIAVIIGLASPQAKAEGEYAWPANYPGVMLQGFYWDSYDDSSWNNLQSQAGELSDYFDLIWVPNSAKAGSTPSMGYNPCYWMTNHNSSFGTEAELREMIKTFSNFGTGLIEDVVINHRVGVMGWMDFPTETYKGVTYEWGPWAVCSTDEVANEPGQEKPTGAPDTGDDWSGCRDLDHTNAKVQAGIKAYLDFLKNDLGYVGWRYDLVKGYAPQYTKIYNESAQCQFSVGEYWDSYDNIVNWIEGTGRQSAAFDFEFKYAVRDAFAGSDFSKLTWKRNGTLLQPAGLVHMDTYQRYAVTFIDNHDTERDANAFTGDVVAANAYMLCSPGTPCVFFKHWQNYKSDIKKLIEIRKAVGITNQSEVSVIESSSTRYIAKVTGTNGELVIKVGRGSYTPDGYTTSDQVAGSGIYAIWTKVPVKSLATERPEVSFSPDGGIYEGGVDVTISVKNAENATVVYTLDGSTPSTDNGTTAANGATVRIDKKTTLKAAAVVDGKVVSAIKTATYFTETTPVTIYFQDPKSEEWKNVYFYAWSDMFAAKDLLGEWPGTSMAGKTEEVGGHTWYKYTTPEGCSIVNLVINNGNGVQTVDIENITGTCYYKLSSMDGGKYTVEDVTSQFAGVETLSATNTSVSVYPNPVVDAIHVASASEVKSIEIYSASGALVARYENTNNANVASLQSGFYFYRVALADGSVAQGKILKK